MYDRISGDVVHRSPTRVVIKSGGIGYDIEIPLSTYERLPSSGEVEILTHLYVREDQLKLFGFASIQERTLFRLLLSISGVGPSLALTVLSGCKVPNFIQAVKNRDVGFLSSVKGIGKKRAERIAMELKDSVSDLTAVVPEEERVPDAISDAVGALVSLGYKKKDAEKAVEATVSKLSRDATVEEIIRTALSGG